MPREKRIDYKEKLSIKSHVKMGVLNEKRCNNSNTEVPNTYIITYGDGEKKINNFIWSLCQ